VKPYQIWKLFQAVDEPIHSYCVCDDL
jgi:hypothetical protein